MSTITLGSGTATRNGHELLDDVVRLFIDLLIAGGATLPSIDQATSLAISRAVESSGGTIFTELGTLQRDCMEVMCRWRREPSLVGNNGLPLPLDQQDGETSFAALCNRAGCVNEPSGVLRALLDFGAVSIGDDKRVRSEMPTFLLGRAAGSLLATDGLLKQLEGYLRVVHRNVRSVAGHESPRFERACTVLVAAELEPVFDRLVRNRGQEFVDTVDEWLERNAKKESPSGRYLALGAGAYFIDLGEQG